MAREIRTEVSKPVKSAEEARARAGEAKDIIEVEGEKPIPVKEKPDSEKEMTIKINLNHDGVEYTPGTVAPKKLAQLFFDKGFAELA